MFLARAGLVTSFRLRDMTTRPRSGCFSLHFRAQRGGGQSKAMCVNEGALAHDSPPPDSRSKLSLSQLTLGTRCLIIKR